MAEYGIVRLDKVQAIGNGNIESLHLTEDLENGSVVTIGGLVTGMGGEQVSVGKPATATLATEEIVLVASPEIVYESKGVSNDLGKFINKKYDADEVAKGTKYQPARGYHLAVGDIVTVTDNMITGTSVVGQFLIPANGSNKLVPATTNTGTTRFVALVIAKEQIHGRNATVYRVIANSPVTSA